MGEGVTDRQERYKKELDRLQATASNDQDFEKRTIDVLREEVQFFEQLERHRKNLEQTLGIESPESTARTVTLITSLDNWSTTFQNKLVDDTSYIAPIRYDPQRHYMLSGEIPKDIGIQGQNAPLIIYYSFRKDPKKMDSFVRWFKHTNLSSDVQIRMIKGQGMFSVVIKDPKQGINVNLADIGFGGSQFLPIIVAGLDATEGSLILVEQPEIHLHPKLQADVADYFAELAKEGKQFVVETHSEHIVLRLQRRVAEGSLDDVAIYYFEASEEGSKIFEVELNQNGTLKKWPPGFFEEDLNYSYSLLKAISEKAEA